MMRFIILFFLLIVSQLLCGQRIKSIEKELLSRVNQFRVENGIDTLTLNPIGDNISKDISNGVYEGQKINLDSLLDDKV